MFNSSYKKEAIQDLEYAVNAYKRVHKATMEFVMALHKTRTDAVSIIKQVEALINTIANTPKEFEKTIKEIEVNRNKFESKIAEIETECKEAAVDSGKVAGAGVAAGIGVAAFGPTAAMAVATTFGTASTGTAIATLSGAAATNAALAWLGGGALAAGGGGMAAGQAFLALAGPVGWVIGGSALIGGGLLLNSKNRKIAEEAEAAARKVNRDTIDLEKIKKNVTEENNLTKKHNQELNLFFKDLENKKSVDYNTLSQQEKLDLGTLVNNTNALSKLINKEVK